MGITNIHHASQVLSYAGREMAVQAVIADLNKGVLLVGRSFTAEEVAAFGPCLRSSVRERWIRSNEDGTVTAGRADDNIAGHPTLYTSPGLADKRNISAETKKDKNGKPIDLAWIIVVRGRSGALFSKVRVFYSRFATAAGILEEALQGYVVAFSAAVSKADLPKLGNAEIPFAKVDSVTALFEFAEQGLLGEIPICC